MMPGNTGGKYSSRQIFDLGNYLLFNMCQWQTVLMNKNTSHTPTGSEEIDKPLSVFNGHK